MKVIILWIGLVLGGANFIHLFAQPTATIVSDDISICETPVTQVQLQIKFEGEAPFGIVYSVYDEIGTLVRKYKIASQDDAIRSEDLVDGVWTSSITVPQTYRFELDEVFDKNSPTDGKIPWSWVIGGGVELNGDPMIVTVDQMASPTAGDDVIGCGFSYQLKGKLEDGAHSMYWSVPGGGEFNDATIPFAVFTAETAGVYTITLNEVNGTCTGTDDVQVTLNGHAVSDMSGAVTICSNDGNNYVMDVVVNIQGVAPFSYKIFEGEELTGTIGDNMVEIPAVEEAVYEVFEMYDGNGCKAHIDSLKGHATVTDDKPAAFAGDNSTECSDAYFLEAVLDKALNGLWTGPSEIVFTDNTDPKTTATATTYGEYTLSWEETYEGCSEQATVDVLFVDPPKDISLVDNSESICDGESAILKINSISVYDNLDLSYSDGTNSTNVTISSPYAELSLLPEEVGLISYQLISVTDGAGCSTSLSDVFNVTVDAMPDDWAGDLFTECGSEATLNASLQGGFKGVWTSDVAGDVFSDINSPSSTISIEEFTDIYEERILTWKVTNTSNANCWTEYSLDKVRFDEKPYNVFAGNDITIYNDNVYGYNATGLNGMTGLWDSESGIIKFAPKDPTNVAKGTATGLKMGANELIWTVSNGVCEDEVSAMLVNVKGLTNPTGFSPNDDDINDYFMIGGADKVTNNKLMIFTVEGKLVYKAEKFGKTNETLGGWDGIGMDGSQLKDGTYYYVFTGDGISPVKDFLVIKGNQ